MLGFSVILFVLGLSLALPDHGFNSQFNVHNVRIRPEDAAAQQRQVQQLNELIRQQELLIRSFNPRPRGPFSDAVDHIKNNLPDFSVVNPEASALQRAQIDELLRIIEQQDVLLRTKRQAEITFDAEVRDEDAIALYKQIVALRKMVEQRDELIARADLGLSSEDEFSRNVATAPLPEYAAPIQEEARFTEPLNEYTAPRTEFSSESIESFEQERFVEPLNEYVAPVQPARVELSSESDSIESLEEAPRSEYSAPLEQPRAEYLAPERSAEEVGYGAARAFSEENAFSQEVRDLDDIREQEQLALAEQQRQLDELIEENSRIHGA